jgi:hypothetical protein
MRRKKMKREMNVRIIETANGEYEVGFVSQLYQKKGYLQWENAAPTTVERLKKKLGAK